MTTRTLPTFTGPNLTGELQLSFTPHLIRRDLRVARVESITPRYRRIVLGGADLDDGFPFRRFTPADHVKVYFPHPDTGQIVAYRQVGEPEEDDWEVDVPGGEPIRRDYTVRGWDPEAKELVLDFVVHDHGVAGVWAGRAGPGEEVVVMGPRANWLMPENYRHYLAFGDETALPAISRIVEEAPAGTHVTAVIEVADAGEEQALVPAPGATAELRWIHRDSARVAEGHLSPLETAARSLEVSELGDVASLYVFAAGEAGAIKPIRRYLRRELGLPKRQTHVDGYWKRGVTEHDHHVPEEDD